MVGKELEGVMLRYFVAITLTCSVSNDIILITDFNEFLCIFKKKENEIIEIAMKKNSDPF